jgi:hypothetical protein
VFLSGEIYLNFILTFQSFVENLGQKLNFENMYFLQKLPKVQNTVEAFLIPVNPSHCMAVCFKEIQNFPSQF